MHEMQKKSVMKKIIGTKMKGFLRIIQMHHPAMAFCPECMVKLYGNGNW